MLKQSLQQKLQQKLSPQQIQLMKLLQVPVGALEQRIKEELELNPALEEGNEESLEMEDFAQDSEDAGSQEDLDLSDYLDDDDFPYYKTQISNHGPDEEQKSMPLSAGTSFHESLLGQIGLGSFDATQELLARHLIGNLDEDGYLMRDLDSVVDDLAFSQGIEASKESLEVVLQMIQGFEPPGVGARDLRECLLLQLKRKPRTELTARSLELLEKYFEEFTRKHYEKIQKRMGLSDEMLREAIQEILHLNPRPGGSMAQSGRSAQVIIPDFLLSVEEGKLDLSLNSKNAPELRVSRTYADMLEGFSQNKAQADKAQKEAVLFVKQKLDAARWFIDAIRQRQETLMAVMTTILDLQKAYFATADERKLRPMILKDVADLVGLDISTVSRVANSKYIETPYGTFLLKSFFSESLSTDSGEEVSTREVKKILMDCIGGESKKKPLTDEKLADILKENGYNIARRTVAKYREQLGIPVARLRKTL